MMIKKKKKKKVKGGYEPSVSGKLLSVGEEVQWP